MNPKYQIFTLSKFAVTLLLMSFASFFVNASVSARIIAQREHLTEKEQDLVREAQELSKRTEVFTKVADRRLLVLSNPNATQTKKEEEKWGALPTGTRAELYGDLARILDEAITNIDDTATRSPKSEQLPKALNALNAYAARILPQLIAMRDKTTDAERERLEQAIENAQAIIDAANKKR
ncbi:MAG: hypothetical protein NVSMB56_18950 [Pyrinomonadaceae bacterium]